ncbi:MAG: chemotaxis protein CheW [Leptolyngbyaceae bacterium]|nr:chemotaxis protein CheW [Leptolyngbyaceae bacterium]
MPNTPVLTFKLHDRCYGIDAHAVREVFLLPEIQSIVARSVAHVNVSMIGVINLRGQLLPVLDLSHYLGDGPHPYALSDSVIVLRQGDRQMGIVVSQIQEVVLLDTATCLLGNGCENVNLALRSDLILNLAQYEDDIVIHLNAETLINSLSRGEFRGEFRGEWATTPHPDADMNERSSAKAVTPNEAQPNETRSNEAMEVGLLGFFPHATEDDLQCLQQRACMLMQRADVDDQGGDRLSVAVLQIHGEQLALPVEYIREFTSIRDVTPIPCCPPHILGNMNLRGEILTLIDIQQALNLQSDNTETLSKAVVVQVDDIITGITVDAVFDVISFEPTALSPVPVGAHTGHEDYLRGVISYQKSQVSVLDLAHLFKSDELMVNAG